MSEHWKRGGWRKGTAAESTGVVERVPGGRSWGRRQDLKGTRHSTGTLEGRAGGRRKAEA